MKVLGIDTATMMGSIGLIDDDMPVAQYSLRVEVTHSERLMEAIDALLNHARIRLEEIDGFAVAAGPGSFTGLRIGLGTVKGLCMATGKGAAAVSTLEALALNIPYCCYSICPVLDARKKEVYAALFRYNEDGGSCKSLKKADSVIPTKVGIQSFQYVAKPLDSRFHGNDDFCKSLDGSVKRITEDMVISPEDLVKMIHGPVVFLGDGVYTYRDLFKREIGNNAHFAPVNAMLPSGLSVAGIGILKLQRGEILGKTGVPVYIRRSEAEIKFGAKGSVT